MNVIGLVEDVIGGPPFAVGDVVRRPSGLMVKITSGQYWGQHGLSNFWHWRSVNPDGSLGRRGSGYGWMTIKSPQK